MLRGRIPVAYKARSAFAASFSWLIPAASRSFDFAQRYDIIAFAPGSHAPPSTTIVSPCT